MESYLRNLDLWCWRYRTNVRSFPGLHLTGKPAACDAVSKCLNQLQEAGDGAYRTIDLRSLDRKDAAKISGAAKYESFPKLRLTFRQPSDCLRCMSFRFEQGVVHFDLTETGLSQLEQGLNDIRAGIGDYNIAPGSGKKSDLGDLDRVSECLWFWPCFGHLFVVNDPQ
jgi:hypothetical protein